MHERVMSHIIPDIIFFGGKDWDRFWRREMIPAMANLLLPLGGKVLCVNRPVDSVVSPVKHTSKFSRWLRQGTILTQQSPNLFVYTPFVPVHDMLSLHVPLLMSVNRRFLALSLNRLLSRLGFHSPHRVSWIYSPYQKGYLGLVGESLAVYENFDEVSLGGTLSWEKALIRRLERQILSQVDLVFATASKLVEAKKSYHSNVHLMPNAVDFENLSRAAHPSTPIAGAMGNLSHPIIGLIGVMNERFDFNLMLSLAEQRPSWTFACIGPVWRYRLREQPTFARFERLPNVKFLGWIPREEMPHYGRAFDVCILPYRKDYEFNEYVNPLALYEYTAMGKPIVSRDIPGVHSYKDIIYVARNSEEFLALIEKSISEDSQVKVEARLQRARDDSWEKRVSDELELIQKTFEQKLRCGVLPIHGRSNNSETA